MNFFDTVYFYVLVSENKNSLGQGLSLITVEDTQSEGDDEKLPN